MPEEQPRSAEDARGACPFCKIVSGEIPSRKVYEDDLFVGVLDINPKAPGHTLLMPKEHYPILPMVPVETFARLFTVAKNLGGASARATGAPNLDIFIANGAVAGQQSQHFMVHLIPSPEGGGFRVPEIVPDPAKLQEIFEIFSHNLPIMIQNHFKRNPGLKPGLEAKSDPIPRYADTKVIYDDTAALAIMCKGALGHVKVYAKGEVAKVGELSDSEAVHLFYVASFAATAAFEALKAQGTNIIAGNTEKSFCIDVFPRVEGDGLNFMWNPAPADPSELDKIAEKVRFEMGSGKGSGEKKDGRGEEKPPERSSPKPKSRKSPEREWQEFNLAHQDDVFNISEVKNV
ncbi:MAG: HIT domain-containing protein [Candidatus Aenigmarchaeota archaeon]|nr:HIT domain-containing protein [Candidatus Aenigmarchaeota archaeon]